MCLACFPDLPTVVLYVENPLKYMGKKENTTKLKIFVKGKLQKKKTEESSEGKNKEMFLSAAIFRSCGSSLKPFEQWENLQDHRSGSKTELGMYEDTGKPLRKNRKFHL